MKTKKHTLKQILSFYKPYKGLFAADLLCSLIAAAIGLVLPLGAGYITDKVLTGDLSAAPGKILGVGALLLGLVLVQLLYGLPGPRHWRPDGAGHARPAVCPLPEAVLLLL